MLFYRYLELVNSQHIEPKEKIFSFVSNNSRKHYEYDFSSISIRKKKTGGHKISVSSKVENIGIRETFIVPQKGK